MRISTSIYAVKLALGEELFEKLCLDCQKESGLSINNDELSFHWVLEENAVIMPPASQRLIKTAPAKFLSVALTRKKYELKLNIKPETGKVWVSNVFSAAMIPKEVLEYFEQKIKGHKISKWDGISLDLYMPMHQKHPGLAEHAVVGGLKQEDGTCIYLLSDKKDPWNAEVWQVYRLHGAKKIAQTLLSFVDKKGQKEFKCTKEGQEVSLKDFDGIKMSQKEMQEELKGLKKMIWKMDDQAGGAIPGTARRFKLGEELSAYESKTIPLDAYLLALNQMNK